jgi:predicted amino acid-binding ACT domain protein
MHMKAGAQLSADSCSIAECFLWFVHSQLMQLAGAVQMLLEFIEYVAADKENMDPAVLKAAVSLLGDLAINVQNIGQLLRQKAFITSFLQECQQVSDDGDDLGTSAAWAGQAIAKAIH